MFAPTQGLRATPSPAIAATHPPRRGQSVFVLVCQRRRAASRLRIQQAAAPAIKAGTSGIFSLVNLSEAGGRMPPFRTKFTGFW